MTTADQNNEITGDKHKVNITSYDLSFNSVYKDYPKQCFPDKLSKPAGTKAKELQYEVLDESLYEQQANMVAFRVPVNKLVPYIKGLSLLYYEIYGANDQCLVKWYDDPLQWNKKSGGKKAICIDVSNREIPLLFKITFHINTGIVQIQGTYKDQFVNKDFPILIDIVKQVIEHNTPTDIQVEGSDEYFTVNQETTAKTLVETTDQPFINNDGNNNKLKVKHSSNHCCGPDHCQSVVAYNQEESVNKLMHNFEDKFTLALEKVCSQQTAMLCKSIETMQEKYAQNIKSYDTKFTDMLNKFSTITDKCVTVEKENSELKCKLKTNNIQIPWSSKLLNPNWMPNVIL